MMRNLALSTIIVAAAIAFELHAQSSVEPADAPTTAVADTQDVTIAFDAAILSETERRTLQAALTFSGDFRGDVNGTWDLASQ